MNTFYKFKIKIKKFKTYGEVCPNLGLSKGTTEGPILSGQTVHLIKYKFKRVPGFCNFLFFMSCCRWRFVRIYLGSPVLS